MVRHACRYGRFRKILPEFPIHRIDGVLHYLPPSLEECDFLVDVSEQIDVWKRMMGCHKSQLDTNPYPDWVLRFASKAGAIIETDYAQGLVSGNPVVVDDVLVVASGIREF
ncbi:hypothetical protein SCG7086_CF_00040 [Chlamydiales bacterium SCGC AG-110-P3]|nr:hypothetical protein SCG7086_CF_00040 [Chlamydiales bacterium SCGC AG-110-P3]